MTVYGVSDATEVMRFAFGTAQFKPESDIVVIYLLQDYFEALHSVACHG